MIDKTIYIIDRINSAIGRSFSWLAFILVIVMFYNVLMRYVLNTNLIWQQELVIFLHAILFLSCAGYCWLKQEHVRVDVLYQFFSKKTQAIVNLVGTLIFAFPIIIVIAFFSYDFIIDSWAIFEKSAEYKGIYGIFILKTFIWFFCFCVFIQGFSTILQSIKILRG